MLAVTFWILVVLAQGTGLQAGLYGAEEDCQKDRQAALVEPTLTAVSECIAVPLTGVKSVSK